MAMSQPALQPIGPFFGAGAGTLPSPRRKRSALAIVTMVVLGLGSLAVAVAIFLSGGPVGGAVTTLLAAISFPVMILLLFWLDRYEPEPGRYRLAALGWGAVIAIGISLLLETIIPSSESIGTAVVAPFVEEFAKALFVVAIVVLRREQLHGVLDGIVYGALVGIGFAFTEDIFYYLQALGKGQLGGTFLLRGILGPFGHPLYTSLTGIGIGIAVMSRSHVFRIVAPILGYLGAVLLHGIWNGTAVWGGDTTFFLVYGLFYLPLLIAAIIVMVWIRRREGRMLTSALDQCAQLGLICRAEIGWVATMKSRVAARKYARQVGGKPAVKVLQDYQQTLTEIGFMHDRVLKGVAPANFRERMAELEQHLAIVRPYVVLPVTIGPGPRAPEPADAQYSPIPQGGSEPR
jgi:RsiW-degrading membrane proteinase PrsW (M82 family)